MQFDDLYSFDSSTLHEVKPMYGVVFLFRYLKGHTNNHNPVDGVYDEDYQDHDIFFANQTIQNACATQAVLNILMNKLDDNQLGEDLAHFRSFVKGFDGMMVGETISNSELIRKVHNSFSSPSFIIDEENPKQDSYNDNDSEVYHFIAYTRINGHIYEFDGLRQYPIMHEKCESDGDFYDKLPDVLSRRVAIFSDELRFSLLGVTINKVEYFRESGDSLSLEQELHKRDTWKRENDFRVHDYLGYTVELLKNLSKEMNDEQWNDLIKAARHKSLHKFRQNQEWN